MKAITGVLLGDISRRVRANEKLRMENEIHGDDRISSFGKGLLVLATLCVAALWSEELAAIHSPRAERT
ncbi:MAG: hypothetical protein ACHQ50_13170 [Fimbriimonadales bacterium]